MSIEKCLLRYAHSEGHTDLCYTEDGKHIITCGSDGDIRLWINNEDPDPESYCVGEVAFSVAQKGNEIYVCIDDGRVIILKYPTGERNGFLTRFTALATHVTVAKNSPMIACAAEDFSIAVFKSSDNTQSTIFNSLQGPALGVTISPDEKLLAASSGDGKLYIWNLEDKKLLKSISCVPYSNSFTSAKILCRASFHPKSTSLAYPNGKEIIIVNTYNFEQMFSLRSDKMQSPFSLVQFSPCGLYIAASSTTGDICIWKFCFGSVPAISEHDQKYNISALVWNPNADNEISFCDVNGQLGTLKYFSDRQVSIPLPISQADLNFVDEDDDDVDNENIISLERIKNEALGVFPPTPSAASSTLSRTQSPELTCSPQFLQPPFQSGSTPIHLTQRFLVYNDVGIVRLHTEEDNDSSIDVMFHDAALYKNLFMKNHLCHTMASLSATVLALACETPSKLVCIPLKSGAKEWSAELSDLEEILCVAASTSIVVIASNVRMLRVFSIFGTQRALLSIPGPVVSTAAFNDTAIVVYHACTAYSKDQNLAAMLIEFKGTNISSQFLPIPITPQSNLTWIGFTDVGSLASYDSGGILRIRKLDSGAWIPACDTAIHAKGASDTYFLVHVSETTQLLRVIHCKGAIYPATTPLPIAIELPMQVPLCEPETDKTQMEEKLFRLSQFEINQPDKAFKETALKLFALACRNNLDDRAFEIIEMFSTSELVNLALKYANKLGRSRLVERLEKSQPNFETIAVDNEIDSTTDTTLKYIKMHPKKMKLLPKMIAEATQVCTPSNNEFMSQEIFTGNSVDSSLKNESLVHSTPVKNPFIKQSDDTPQINPISVLNTSNFNVEITSPKPEKSTEKTNNEEFKTWFAREKPGLQLQHPKLSTKELIKFALKLFKQQVTEKRKAKNESENARKSKQPKLSDFSFKKHI